MKDIEFSNVSIYYSLVIDNYNIYINSENGENEKRKLQEEYIILGDVLD